MFFSLYSSTSLCDTTLAIFYCGCFLTLYLCSFVYFSVVSVISLFSRPSLFICPSLTLSFLDSTTSIVARRRRFHRFTQEIYELPVVVWDGGEPLLSSTSTLTLRVCQCQHGTQHKICQGEAFLSSAGLSTGALIAILLCVLILLGKSTSTPCNFTV